MIGKKKAMIIMSALLIMTIAAFLVAFIKYRPVQEDGLIAIKGQISKLEYYGYSKFTKSMSFYLNGVKYIYTFPDNTLAKEQFEEFNEYITTHHDDITVFKEANDNDKIVSVDFGNRSFSLDNYNSYLISRRIVFVVCGSICLLLFITLFLLRKWFRA